MAAASVLRSPAVGFSARFGTVRDVVAGRPVWVTASIGAAVCRGDGNAASVLRDTDATRYRAKRSGGNQVLV